jgi:hypothetical protein
MALERLNDYGHNFATALSIGVAVLNTLPVVDPDLAADLRTAVYRAVDSDFAERFAAFSDQERAAYHDAVSDDFASNIDLIFFSTAGAVSWWIVGSYARDAKRRRDGRTLNNV